MPDELSPSEWRIQFAMVLHDRHGRPMKLANQIALTWSGVYQDKGFTPEHAASAWVAENDARESLRRRSGR